MSFPLRRAVTRLHLHHRKIHLHRRNLSSKQPSSTPISDAALDAIPPIFTQTPPLWVRFAWPLIIGNALLLASAIDITWNHWSTLVKDLEAVAERNRQNAEAKRESDAVTPSSSSAPAIKPESQDGQNNTLTIEPSPSASSTPISSATAVDTSKKEEPTHHWEHRPTWQRASFCGIYVIGWAFSTAYLLKYRQTYVTRVKFFRGPSPSKILSPASPTQTPSLKTPSPPSSTPTPPLTKSTLGSDAIMPPAQGPQQQQQQQQNRFIHIQTAAKPKGITIPLNKLSLYEGRNETELVIRSNSASSSTKKSRWNRTGRDYWFMSLSEAIVDGTRFAQVGKARDRIVQAWFGYDDDGKKKKKKGAKKV